MQADEVCAQYCTANGTVVAVAEHLRKYHGASDPDIIAFVSRAIGYEPDVDLHNACDAYGCGADNSELISAYQRLTDPGGTPGQ